MVLQKIDEMEASICLTHVIGLERLAIVHREFNKAEKRKDRVAKVASVILTPELQAIIANAALEHSNYERVQQYEPSDFSNVTKFLPSGVSQSEIKAFRRDLIKSYQHLVLSKNELKSTVKPSEFETYVVSRMEESM